MAASERDCIKPMVRRLGEACRSIGVNPYSVFPHWSVGDVKDIADDLEAGWLTRDQLPGVVMAKQMQILTGSCFCPRCRPGRPHDPAVAATAPAPERTDQTEEAR